MDHGARNPTSASTPAAPATRLRRVAVAVAAVCALTVPAGCSVAIAGSASPAPGPASTRSTAGAEGSPGGPAGTRSGDPSSRIPGILIIDYTDRPHVRADQQIAYTHSPPFGGAHDGFWAACTGVVYPTAVRQENLVHSLEHGAVWIAYDPDRISGAALATLAAKVTGRPYTVMAPYPGLDQPISLQSWGHQLKLSDADDPRIDRFIAALRENGRTYPEAGATCRALGPGQFDQDAPPPFRPTPPVEAIDGTTVVDELTGAAPAS